MNKQLQTIKIAVTGPKGVGKTGIVSHINKTRFEIEYFPTLGVEYSSYNLELKDKIVKFKIYDLSGMKMYFHLVHNYIRDCHIIIYVYDTSDFSSFNELKILHEAYKNKNAFSNHSSFIIIGNKTDIKNKLTDKYLYNNECIDFINEVGANYFSISAKTSEGVNELTQYLINLTDKYIEIKKTIDKYNSINLISQNKNTTVSKIENTFEKEKEDENYNTKKNKCCNCIII